jgi:DNA-binding NarL/FixJ family response regulator
MSDTTSPPCPIGKARIRAQAAASSEARDAMLARADESKPMHPLKTYIVEDSPVIRDNLVATLEELLPLRVVGTAADESTALAWLGQAGHAVDLVIIDIFLERGSGLGVLRQASGLQHGAKLVVLSNYATADMRRRCLELGADKVFDKSEEIDALIQYCARLAADEAANSRPGAPH